MATAQGSSSHPGWQTIREAVLPSLAENPSSKSARANWRFVMDALIDDAPETDAERQQPTVAPPTSTTTLETPKLTPPVDGPSTSRQPLPASPSVTLEEAREKLWGSRQDVEDLNEDIRSCLEIEGFQNPSGFFTEDVQNFPSVAHYYADLLNKLDEAGIDLFLSLQYRLGEDHILVQGIRTVLSERPPRPSLSREAAEIAEQIDRDSSGITVPGFRAFSEESRSLSWVVRTDQVVVPRGLPTGQLPTIPGSMDGRYGPVSQVQKQDQIVCPGLPISFDIQQQQQPIVQQPTPEGERKTMIEKLMSCFCFAK